MFQPACLLVCVCVTLKASNRRTKCFARVLIGYVTLWKILVCQGPSSVSKTFIKRTFKLATLQECQLKQAKPRQTMTTLLNFLKTNSKKTYSTFPLFQINLESRPEIARRRLRNCTTPRGVDFTTKSLSNLVRFALTQVLIKHVRRSVEPGCCSCVVLSSFPRCRT